MAQGWLQVLKLRQTGLPDDLLTHIVDLAIQAEREQWRVMNMYTRRSRRAYRRIFRWYNVRSGILRAGSEEAYRATLHANSRHLPHFGAQNPPQPLALEETTGPDSDAGMDSEDSRPPSPVYSDSDAD